MIGDDQEGIQPWMQIAEGPVRDLLFAYEAILTEMRTHGDAGDRMPAEWVRRLDQARDEFVRSVSRQGADERDDETRSNLLCALYEWINAGASLDAVITAMDERYGKGKS